MLDTARLRALVGQRLNIDPRSVHGYVIGEHGDSEVVVWSRATVAGLPIDEFCSQRGSPCDADMQAEISEQVRRAAYEIIERKGATYYAIGLGVRHVVEAILRDQSTVLTVSTLMTGQFGISDICLSLPSIVDHGGVEGVLLPKLSDDELAALRRSADVLKETAPGGRPVARAPRFAGLSARTGKFVARAGPESHPGIGRGRRRGRRRDRTRVPGAPGGDP